MDFPTSEDAPLSVTSDAVASNGSDRLGYVVANVGAATLAAVNSDGTEAWRVNGLDPTSSFASTASTWVVQTGTGGPAKLTGYRWSDGQVAWEVAPADSFFLRYTDRHNGQLRVLEVFADGATTEAVSVIDPETGQRVWTARAVGSSLDVPGANPIQLPTPIDDESVVDGDLYLFAQSDSESGLPAVVYRYDDDERVLDAVATDSDAAGLWQISGDRLSFIDEAGFVESIEEAPSWQPFTEDVEVSDLPRTEPETRKVHLESGYEQVSLAGVTGDLRVDTTVDERQVAFIESDDTIYGIEYAFEEGQILWSKPASVIPNYASALHRDEGDPMILASLTPTEIAAGEELFTLTRIDPTTGEAVWRWGKHDGTWATLTPFPQHIAAVEADQEGAGRVAVLDLETGNEVWSTSLGTRPNFPADVSWRAPFLTWRTATGWQFIQLAM